MQNKHGSATVLSVHVCVVRRFMVASFKIRPWSIITHVNDGFNVMIDTGHSVARKGHTFLHSLPHSYQNRYRPTSYASACAYVLLILSLFSPSRESSRLVHPHTSSRGGHIILSFIEHQMLIPRAPLEAPNRSVGRCKRRAALSPAFLFPSVPMDVIVCTIPPPGRVTSSRVPIKLHAANVCAFRTFFLL